MGNTEGKFVLNDTLVEKLSASSGLDQDKVREMGNNFLAESPNGVIKKKQFRSIMKILQPDMNMGKMEKNVFRMFDLDQDGEISIEEFLMLLQILQGGTPEETLKRIFMIFDVDRNDVIDKKELRKIVKDMGKFIARNTNQKVDQDLITDSAWKEMDKNGDGKVSREEFVRAVMAGDKWSQFITKNVVDWLA